MHLIAPEKKEERKKSEIEMFGRRKKKTNLDDIAGDPKNFCDSFRLSSISNHFSFPLVLPPFRTKAAIFSRDSQHFGYPHAISFFHCTLYSRTYHSRVRGGKRLSFSLVRSYSLPSLNTSKSGRKKKRISQDCHIGPGGRIRTTHTHGEAFLRMYVVI